MHPGGGLSGPAECLGPRREGDRAPRDRAVAHEAARWLVRLELGQASPDDLRALDRWRARSAEHERAWQRAQALRHAFGAIPPGLGMATLGRPPSARRTMLKALAALIVAPPAALAAWRAAPLSEWTAGYRTATGERRDVRLADGTRLHLNTATSIDTEFDDGARGVRLYDGEIYVETAPDAARPLVVRTRLGTVQTRDACFSVWLREERCRVAVAAGEVALRPARADAQTPAIVLPAPRQAWFDAHEVAPDTPTNARQPDWLRGVLHADAMRLDAFAAELARYRPGIVRCDPAVAGLRLSGAFQLDNTEGVLRALPALLPVRVRDVTTYWVTLAPASEA